MGFSHSTYFAYGVHIETTAPAWSEEDRIGKILTKHRDQVPNVSTLSAGDYDRDRLFLVTEAKEVKLGTFAHITPQSHTAEQLTEWTQQLTAAADMLGILPEQRSKAGWLCVPDVS